jgi:hypothetical protein
MSHAKPEYAIVIAIIGVFMAIGIPALKRGQIILGWSMCAIAAVIVIWFVVTLYRSRG